MNLWPAHYTPPAKPPRFFGIANALVGHAAQAIRFTPDEVTGQRRHKMLIAARSAIAIVLLERGWSYPRIGRALNRDHTTIVHAVQVWPARARTYPERLELLAELRRFASQL